MINTLSLDTAITVLSALVDILTTTAEVVFITLALSGEPLSMSAAQLFEVFAWLDVDISAGPEVVGTAPLVGLALESDCAVLAHKFGVEMDFERLCAVSKEF